MGRIYMRDGGDGEGDRRENVNLFVGGKGKSRQELKKSLKVTDVADKSSGLILSTEVLERPVDNVEVVVIEPSESPRYINGMLMVEEFSFYEDVFPPSSCSDTEEAAPGDNLSLRTEMDEIELDTLEQFESNDLGPIPIGELAQASLAFTGRKAGLRSSSVPLVRVFVNRVAMSLEGGRWFVRAGLRNKVLDIIELDRTELFLKDEVRQEYDYGQSYGEASYTASAGPQMSMPGNFSRSRSRLPLNSRVCDYYHQRNAQERDKEMRVDKCLFVKYRIEIEGVERVKLLLASKGLNENDDIWKETIIFVKAAARALDHDMTSGKKEFDHEKDDRERMVIPYSLRLTSKVAWTILNENGYQTSLSEVSKFLLDNPGCLSSISKIDDLEEDNFVNDLLRLVSKAVLVHVAKNR